MSNCACKKRQMFTKTKNLEFKKKKVIYLNIKVVNKFINNL